MPIKFTAISPKRIQEADGLDSEYKFVTHEVHTEDGETLFLVTDYEEENPSLYVFRVIDEDVLSPIDDDLAAEVSKWISAITIPEFPTLEQIKELLTYD